MKQFDIAVIGGGMVGAAVAVGFARQGKRVAVVEYQQPKEFDATQPMDLRVSAISQASVNFLEDLGAWKHIESMRACPYKRLETWDMPDCRTRFHSDSLNMDQLGFIVENRLVQLGIWKVMADMDNITLMCPEGLESVEDHSDHRIVKLSSGESIQANWVVGADGANSKVRDLAKIGVTAWDYRQHCMLVNVKTAKPQQDITWQQFTSSGPRSFLPLTGHQGSVVWYDSPEKIRALLAMNHQQLAEAIMTSFPAELGKIEVELAGAFPLTRRHAQSYFQKGCVLVGDAAHTINPLAGQGVNLGFKDVKALLDFTADLGMTEQALSGYQSERKRDNLLMQTGMDVFYKVFKETFPPLAFARNAALKLAEHSGPVKQQVLRYALGL
ncbi:2-octaprenyl-3-methyl-6-methoxy-1,4-benzoquinol hydroxylase [Vibrio nigripulchritudo]|uniref:2-octaprenyl-3-methyl-6-methoxy-1,4-benzoquinol hydroxylase n=1 Tax=Vibrio nigripulchritudo TaxID=28173 RepID=UPI0003B215CF|nr:2-octaprenyl-3-methyl-6-methoxy-1,4-benzoquinol hydroxylase [Vibrio nigripulchritudo]CCN70493.1 2-octaprenyl-3-methyl-6-methoxy-1,4-benzoquinol hydroxylase [Vibrio nigripulchritudo SFn118]